MAKLLNSDPSKPPLTANGAVIGSPVYMSPEQLLGKKTVDARSDVWQLGVILHELVSGDCPFDGRSMADIMLAIGVHPAKPLRSVRPDVPVELEALVLRCLEKDAAKRLPDVAALAEGLLPFATTRRAQVSVEQIVTLLRGAQAAANLPPMREKNAVGGALFMGAASEPAPPSGRAGQARGVEPVRPDDGLPPGEPVQRASVPGAPPPGADRMSNTPPPANLARERSAQTGPPTNMPQTATPGPAMVPWIVAGVLVVAGLALAAFGLGARAHDGQAKPAQVAPAPTK